MRVQLELDDSAVEMISEIKAAAREKMTYKEFFSVAIGFLNWAAKRVESGLVIAAVDEDNKTYAHITMPLFDKIQMNAVARKQKSQSAAAQPAVAARAAGAS